MRNPKSSAGFGVSENHHNSNLRQKPQKSNSTNDLARRDAAVMVHILNGMSSGIESFEIIYQSLKQLHGPDFDRYFHNGLINQEARNGGG